jgi:hypothetical protein
MQDVSITNELHTIDASSPYTIRLIEVPLKDTPSSITVRLRAALGEALDASETGVDLASEAQASWFTSGDVITIDSEQMLVGSVSGATLTVTRAYNSTTAATHTTGTAVYGEPFEEVSAAPTAGQYWPDYTTGANSDENWNTGTLKFNPADAGKIVAVSYQGTGVLADHRLLSLAYIYTDTTEYSEQSTTCSLKTTWTLSLPVPAIIDLQINADLKASSAFTLYDAVKVEIQDIEVAYLSTNPIGSTYAAHCARGDRLIRVPAGDTQVNIYLRGDGTKTVYIKNIVLTAVTHRLWEK